MSEDVAADILRELGYLVKPVDWSLEDFAPRGREIVVRFRLLAHYDHPSTPFQIFHLGLNTRNLHLQVKSVLDPFCRKRPQAHYFFVFSYTHNDKLLFVLTNTSADHYLPARYHAFTVFPRHATPAHLLKLLRVASHEQNAEQLVQKHQQVFDLITEWQLRERHDDVVEDEVDAQQIFLSDLAWYPQLSAQTQLELIAQAQRGGDESKTARDKLVAHNLRLVMYFARKYQGRGLDLLDLVNEGSLGLMRAIDLYNVTKGYQFSTYATHWIRQKIRRAVVDKGRLVRLPVHAHDYELSVQTAEKNLTDLFRRTPTNFEIALYLQKFQEDETALGWLSLVSDWRPDRELQNKFITITRRVSRVRRWHDDMLSLEIELNPAEIEFIEVSAMEIDIEELSVFDVLPAEEESPLDSAARSMQKEIVHQVLQKLPERERLVLEMRYGIVDGQFRTLDEVGQHLNVTRERIRQIENKAIDDFIHAIKANSWQNKLGVSLVRENVRADAQTDETEDAVSTKPIGTVTLNKKRLARDWLALTSAEHWNKIVESLKSKTPRADDAFHYHPLSLYTYLEHLDEDALANMEID